MKRAIDLAIVIPSLIVLSPLLLAIAVCIKLCSPGPVLFRQRRVGWRGRTFRICKFRTMVAGSERRGPKVTAATDPRITRLGQLLRHTKLDELPQLLNVLIGNMSLVGPRPQVPRFVHHYPEPTRSIVLSVRPGITDPATLAFRHEEELLAGCANPERCYIEDILPRKLAMYEQYIRRRTIASDLWIMAITAVCLLRHSHPMPTLLPPTSQGGETVSVRRPPDMPHAATLPAARLERATMRANSRMLP